MTYTVADEDRQGGQTIKNGQIIKSVVHMKDCKNRRFRYGFTKQASKNLSQNLTFSQKKNSMALDIHVYGSDLKLNC